MRSTRSSSSSEIERIKENVQRIRENCLFFQNLILDDKKNLIKNFAPPLKMDEQEDTGTRKLFFRIIEYKIFSA